MSRYSRGSDDGFEDRRFRKKRRLLHDASTVDDSLCQFKKANSNWNEVLDDSDRRVFDNEMRRYSSGGTEISRSSKSFRQNRYSDSNLVTPGSSFFCNSEGDSESIASSFRARPKHHKRDIVLSDEFKSALSRDVTLAQDPSFGAALESNKSCFITDNSGSCTSDTTLDIHNHKGLRMKYRRHNAKKDSAKNGEDFENILNDVTTCDYQSRMDPSTAENNANEFTHLDLNEVSHFKPNETGYGAPSAITYCHSSQVVTQTGQVGGMTYVTISEVKERVIIPGRSCPRPVKKKRTEGTADWMTGVNYDEDIDLDHGNSSMKTTNSIAEMGIHREGIKELYDPENQYEILSDFEVERDDLNRSGPRPSHYSPLRRSRERKQRNKKYVISKDVYEEVYKDDSIINSDINIASSFNITEIDDSNTNNSLRSHKAVKYQKNARHSRSRNQSYGSSLNDLSLRSHSRRSILNEIRQNEFELISMEDDNEGNGDSDDVLRKRDVSRNSEKVFISKIDAVKKVHDHVTNEKIKRDMSTEVRKMARKFKESFSESNIESDENAMNELDLIPMIMEKRSRRRNKNKKRVENEFDTAQNNCSMSDSVNSVSFAPEETSVTKKGRLPKTLEKCRKGRDIVDLKGNVHNSMKCSSSGSKDTSMEAYQSDEEVRKEESSLLDVEKPKRRSNRRKRKGSKEFNLTIENASLSSTADSLSMQNSASFMHKENAITSNSNNDDEIQLIEGFPLEHTLKEIPSLGKLKGNCSKSMSIIDSNIEKEGTFNLNRPQPRRRRNQVKATKTDEFNAQLEDVSSNMEESISAVADASCQSNVAHKSLVSAIEIQAATVDHQKTSKQVTRDSTLTTEKKMSNESESNFEKRRLLSDNFKPEVNSPIIDTVRPKRRNQVKATNADEFNALLEDVLSNMEESISSVADSSNPSKLAHKSSISADDIPDVALDIQKKPKQSSRDSSLTKEKEMSNETESSINKSRSLSHDPCPEANSPVVDIASPKKSKQSLSVKDDVFNVHLEDASSETEEFIPLIAVASQQSKVVHKSSASVSESPDATDKQANSSKQETEEDTSTMNKQVNDDAKIYINRSSIIADPNLREATISPERNATAQATDNKMKLLQGPRMPSKNGQPVSLVSEDIHESKVVEESSVPAVIMPKSTVRSENSNKKNNLEEEPVSADKIAAVAVESQDTSKNESASDANIIDQQVNDETKRNISKSRVAFDEESSLDVKSPVLNIKSLRRRKQRRSVKGDDINIAMEDVSLSNAANSITSIAEDTHNESLASGKVVEATVETVNRKESVGAPAIDQQLQDSTKRNISKSRLMSDEELSTVSTAMDVGRSCRRRKQVKSVQGNAFAIAMEDVSLSIASDSIPSVAETSHHSDSAQNECAPAEEIPKAPVEQSLASGKVVEATVETVNRKTSVDNATAIDKQLQDNTIRNISKSRLMSEEELSTVYTAMDVGRSRRRRKQVKSVQGDAFAIAMEDVSLSIASDSIASVAETSHHSDSAQNECAPAEEIPKATVEQSLASGKVVEATVETVNRKESVGAPAIDQQLQDSTKRNITKSRLMSDEELSTVSTVMDVGRSSRRRKQVKSVQGDAFAIAMEDVSLSIASDSIASVAETSHHSDSAQNECAPAEEIPKATVGQSLASGKVVEATVETVNRKSSVDNAPAIDQQLQDNTKRNISKSRLMSDEELSTVSTVMDVGRSSRRRKQVKSVQGDAFAIAMEDVSLSIASDSIASVAETSLHSDSAQNECAPAEEIPKATVGQSLASGKVVEATVETVNRKSSVDNAPAIDQQLQDNTKRNISKSRLMSDEELSTVSTVMDVGRSSRRRKQVKSVQGDAFAIAMEDVSLSIASDSIASVAETSHHSDSAQNECAPAEEIPKATVEQSLASGKVMEATVETVNRKSSVDDAPAIDQKWQDNTKRNISKSRLMSEEELSTVSTAMDVELRSRRRKQVKSVQGDAFAIAMEDVSLSIASDSIASLAETSHHSDSAQNECASAEELPEATVEPENSLRKKAECVVSDINQEVNYDLKRETSDISLISVDELNLDADVTVLDDRRQRRKRTQAKTVQVNQFKILVEDISLSNSISSIAETSQNEKSVKVKAQEGPVESKDISKQKPGVVDPAIDQEMNDDAKFKLSKSRLVLEGESSLDAKSIVMDIRRKRKRRNNLETVQNDEFKTAVEDISLIVESDSMPSEAEASNQLKVAQKSTKLGHPQLVSGFTGHAETNTSRIQILVDGKVAEKKPVQSEIVTENKPDLPQIICSMDNSLSVSKISNVFVNDVAESTRGFINKGLIYEYFGNVSGITNDTLTDKEDCTYQAEFPLNKSKKSLDLINNKNETSELPHEALRGKSGGENFALDTFLIHSLEKHSLHSPDRVKSTVQINVSARNISDLERCGVDLDMPVSLIAEGAISSTGLSENGELDIIEPPTEAPSKSELSMSLKSNVQNLEDNIEASGNSNPEKLNEDIFNFKVAVENIEEEQPNESANRTYRGNGDSKHEVSKQNENLPTNVTTAPGGVGELGEPFIEHIDMDKSNPSVVVASISVEAAAQASSSKSKSAQIKAAAEVGTVVLIEKVVETPSNLVSDHIAVAEEVPSNQNSEKLEDNKITATNAVDLPIENLTDLISEPLVSIAPEEISTVQPDAKEPISCTSSTADTAEKLHQTLAHNMLSSKSAKILTEGGISKDLSNQNSHLQIKLFVEQNSEVVKQLSNAESSKGETIIKSCLPNPTIAPKLMSKLPVPIKCNKKSITSKSSCLLKNPSSPPKLVFHDLPEKEKHLKKLDTLKSINEETFTILPLSNSSEKADNLIDEVLKNPGESLLSLSEAPKVHDNVHTVSRALDCENLNADEQTKDPVISNEKSEKLSPSKSFAFLETQAKTSTTINELTFIKTAAPGMTSTPLPSIPYFLKIRCTEDDSMLSGISELTLDQIVAQEHISDAEQHLDPVPKGSLSVSESSPAIHELTPIKSNCHLSTVGEEGSPFLCHKTQNQDVSLNRKSIPVTNEAKESTDLKAVKILNNSPVPDDLKSSPQSSIPCNHSKDDGVNTDSQKPVSPIVACATPPDPTHTIPKPSPELNGASNKQGETFSELLLLSPLSTSKWNDICHTSDSVPSVLSSEAGDYGKITSTGRESGISSNPRCTGKSPIESEVGHNRNSGTAIEKTIDSSGLHNLKEVDVSHFRAPRPISFELNHPRPFCSSDSEKKFRNTVIGEQEINVSGPFCLRKAEGKHLRLSEAVRSEFIQSRPSSSLLSERSSLRPSISNHPRWSSSSSSAKESDADLTRPGLSSHTSGESSEPELISPEPESLSTPLRTRYRYFSTPTTADRKAVYKVIDRIDASAVKRKKQRELIFDTIYPKVISASNEFKKPKIPPKPKKVQVEDFDEDDEQEIKPPEKKRRLPVWARHELKTVVSEAIEEQEDNLLDPQDFLFDLVDTIKLVVKSKRVKEVRQGVQKVKQKLFNLKLIRTLREFYQFVRDYLPYEFRTRSIPSSGHFKFNPLWEMEADLDQPLFHFSE